MSSELSLRPITRATLPAVLALRAESTAVASNAESLCEAHGCSECFSCAWGCSCLSRCLLDESGSRELGRGRSVFFRAIHAAEVTPLHTSLHAARTRADVHLFARLS